MAEKCFCHLNGYKVKDADARAHMENKQNPHNVTAAQVGARPDTWTPTAAQVGARPSTWTPTAADVGALPAKESAQYPGCFYIESGDTIKWINPPIVAGVGECLTTRFFNGDPVYVRTCGTGDLPSNGTKTIDFSAYASNVKCVFNIYGTTSQGHVVPYNDGDLKIDVSMLGTNIYVTTNKTLSGYPNATLVLEYCKN